MFIDFKQLATKCGEYCELDPTGNVAETLNECVQYLLLSSESEFNDETLDDDELPLNTVFIKNTLIREKVLVFGNNTPVSPVNKKAPTAKKKA
jgi:hypothetical protein